MTIIELKCPACNATLTIDEDNPDMATCEYCKARYVLEREGNDAWLRDSARPSPPPLSTYHSTPAPARKTSGNGIMVAVGLGMLVLTVGAVAGLALMSKPSARQTGTNAAKVAVKSETEAVKVMEEPLTGVLAEAMEQIFGQPADTITPEQLSEIKQLKASYTMDSVMLGYSMEEPLPASETEWNWIAFNRDTAKLDMKALSRLNGLVKLELPNSTNSKELKGLHLVSLTCRGKNFRELAACLSYPEELKELSVLSGLESLDGLEQFTGLERLAFAGSDLKDIKELVTATNLKAVSIDANEISDFSVLSIMPWLEEISVESEKLKDIGFVQDLSNLKKLTVNDSKIIGLSGLEKRQDSLESLTISRCSDLKECGAITALTGLRSLNLAIPYQCTEPDLSGLAAMEDLTLSGFDSVSCLRGMPLLKKLCIEVRAVDHTDVFTNLTQLEELTCKTFTASQKKLDFITRLPALKKLNLTGASTYYDISGIFNMPMLETLIMDGVECEINFSKLSDNGTLKYLSMDGIKLYKNAQISGGGGIYSINWDDVTLNDNTSFLSHYPNLEHLSIAENNLTSVEFAAGLMNLKTLDIRENYITDLKPLARAASLSRVEATGNPISNDKVLADSVTLIR